MFLLDAINARPAQPQGAFSVAPDLAAGLLAVFNAPNPSTDWVRSGTLTQQPVAGGVAFESGASNSRYEKTVVGNQNTGYTMHLRFTVRATSPQDYAGFYNGATYQSLFYVGGTGRLFFYPKNGTSVQAHSKVLAVGDVVSICATANGARYYIATTINGITERVTATYTGTSAYTLIHIGAKFTTTGLHRTMTGAFWARALPDELADLLARSPVSLFDSETHGVPVTFEAGDASQDEEGGSASLTDVTAAGAGAGAEAASGGSSSVVDVASAGAGAAAESTSGGAASLVEVTAAGAGTKQEAGAEEGGSASVVEVTSAGAGSAFEAAQGGSGSAVDVTAAGAGVKVEEGAAAGGSSSVVDVTSAGGGVAVHVASGGAASIVRVLSFGAGSANDGSILPPVRCTGTHALAASITAGHAAAASVAASHRLAASITATVRPIP